MPVTAIGIDLASVETAAEVLAKPGVVDRIFNAAERHWAETSARPMERFAALFAAKEAVLKALGTGWTDDVDWRDVHVRVDGNVASVELTNGAAASARAQGLGTPHANLETGRAYAVAVVIFEAETS